MVTYTLLVREDGTIRLPLAAARPGDTVVVHIERSDRVTSEMDQDDEDFLTVVTANTPEKRERFLKQVHDWSQHNRAELSQEDLDFDYDAWLYDENGLPR